MPGARPPAHTAGEASAALVQRTDDARRCPRTAHAPGASSNGKGRSRRARCRPARFRRRCTQCRSTTPTTHRRVQSARHERPAWASGWRACERARRASARQSRSQGRAPYSPVGRSGMGGHRAIVLVAHPAVCCKSPCKWSNPQAVGQGHPQIAAVLCGSPHDPQVDNARRPRTRAPCAVTSLCPRLRRAPVLSILDVLQGDGATGPNTYCVGG